MKLEDNNRGKVQELRDKKTGVATKPDSLGKDKKGKPIIHDHKHFSKGKQVQNRSPQMKAQQNIAKDKNGRHVVTMSSSKPSLNGNPPKPRPSGPLAKKSEVYYTDKDGNVTHQWKKDKETGKGYWDQI